MKILINNQEQDNIKAIQIDDYFVIVDTKANTFKNCIRVTSNNNLNWRPKIVKDIGYNLGYNTLKGEPFFYENTNFYNIIASTKRIDSTIPLIVFKEQNVEELAENYVLELIESKAIKDYEKSWMREVFKYIYNQAKSSDKKYIEKDILDVIQFTKDLSYMNGTKPQYLFSNKDILSRFQSLNQTKLPDVINLQVECGEIRQCECINNSNCLKPKLKTLTMCNYLVQIGRAHV